MQILCLSEKSVQPFIGRINKLSNLNILKSDRIGRHRALKDNGEPNEQWINRLIQNDFDFYQGTIDVLYIFIDSSNWTREGSLGVNLGRIFNGTHVCIVKRHSRYYDTAEHEFWHAMNDYIYQYTGIKLATVFGVDDFDEDIVHGKHLDYEEYEYDDLYEKVEPYYQEALRIDNKQEIRSLLQKLKITARKYITQLRKQLRDVS